jgi:hypothetical protein
MQLALVELQHRDKVMLAVERRHGVQVMVGQPVVAVVLVDKVILQQTMTQVAQVPVLALVAPVYHHLLQALL